ncbi:MAG TPA: methyltransferase [Microthrixaceae bacterium]|nr:methyltransferase [Microthrixaceae bacterium]
MAYTHGHHESVLRSHRWRTAENSCAYLLPHLRPDHLLLDVGCGPGTITADLAGRLGSIVGIDPSASVIAEARADHPDLDLRAEDLFGHEGHYDVVHAHQVLQHLADPVGALQAMAELGSLVAVRDSDYPAMVWSPDSEHLDRWLDVYLRVTRHNGANADAGRRLVSWAQAAGLEEIRYSTSTWTFATPDERTWWSELWAERTTSSAFAEQAVEYGIATADELAEVARGWRDWATNDDALFVVLHGELVARGRPA